MEAAPAFFGQYIPTGGKMYTKQIATVGLVAGSVIWASAAGAATITIGARPTSTAAFTQQGPSSTTGSLANTFSFSAGANTNQAWTNAVLGQFTAPPAIGLNNIFDSTSINIRGSMGPNPSTIGIAVTASDLSDPVSSPGNSLIPLISSFTSNALPTGWTATEQTFLNTDNSVFGMETPLGSASCTASGCVPATAAPVLVDLNAPYSLTAFYAVTSTGTGTANLAIDIAAQTVPIPGTLPLFASGLGALGLLWRKKRKAPRSTLPLTA